MAAYDSVRVACRFRPINEREKNERQAEIVIDILDCKKQVRIKGKKSHTFTFDRAFEPNATQQEVFDNTGAKLVDEVLQGINCTLFAYGQTGSGKTHTMEGQIGSLKNEGLIPRMVRKLFDSIDNMQDNVRYALRVSYVEIYNEKLRDLLDPTKKPRVRGGIDGRNIKVENSHEQYVSSPEQVFELLYAGQSNRSVSATKMNSASSRSHAVFMLSIDREESNGTKKKSKLLMVDLAGSEKVKKTEAKGALLEEAKNINQSLSTLGNVINALTKGGHHVPYRDSVLTRLLSDALGGNSKTILIIAASPALFNAEETLSTLRFGKRAKEIKNRVAVNEELSIDQYKARLAAAKLKITKLEQNNNILKRKLKQMMLISSKSNDKDMMIKFENVVRNTNIDIGVHASSSKQRKRHKRTVSTSIIPSLSHLNADNSLNTDNSLEKDAEILSLKKKLAEVNEELNRAENAERMVNDAKAELYEGHLQLREEYVELNDKLKHLQLHNDTSQTKIEALQTLLDDSKLRTTQKQQEFRSKEKHFISKLQRLHKEITILKQQTKRFGTLPQSMNTNHEIQMSNDIADIDDIHNMEMDDSKLDGNIHQLSSRLLQSADATKKHELQLFLNKTKEQHQKHKLLQDRYKKMSDILSCYKERDETNYALRKAWTKHMNALEKALCQQDAATLRWREQTKSHEEVLKTEIERLRNNIRHFQQFKRYGTTSPHIVSTMPLSRKWSNGSMPSTTSLSGNNQDTTTVAVASAPPFAVHQQQIIPTQASQQFVPTYSHPTYVSNARLANPTYIIPRYIQADSAFAINTMPQIRPQHAYITTTQPTIQHHDYNLQ